MASTSNYKPECTKRCKSVIHGNQITAAFTKRSVPDEIVVAFSVKRCKNFAEISDKEGRTALHFAASTNRTLAAEWLLRNGANPNAKDLESGQTPLHRALFYGCIKTAIVLLQNNASMDECDSEYLSPLHYCRPVAKRRPTRRYDTEVFAFGSNSHYNLGLDMDQGTSIPKCIEYFRRNNVCIKTAALSSFHSLFLSNTNDMYAVGHGLGGRLGHGEESTLVQPQKLNVRLKRTDEKIISLSVSKNHSLILTSLNHVYACGSNNMGQLGLRTNETNLLEFKNINFAELQDGQNLIRVIALENHSLVYNSDSVFAWGYNTGQLGLRSAEGVIAPQRVLSGQQILLFDGCATGMAFYSQNKFLNVFSNYKMKFFKTPGLEVVKQLAIGDADKLLKVLVMTESCQIYIWDDASQKYTKCFYAMCRQLDITRILWSGNRIVFLAAEDVLMSTTMNAVNYNESDEDVSDYQEIYSTKKDVCQTSRIKIGLRRIPFASNVKDVWSDYEGLNCLFTRDDPYMHLKVPTINDQEFSLDELDFIHDVWFHVERQVFPAHKFVLFSRAENTFRPWVEAAVDQENCYVDIEGLTAAAFEIILKIIYRNHILTEDDVARLDSTYKARGNHQPALPVFTKLMMERLQLGHFLQKNKKNMPRMSFERNKFTELYDVNIKCANDREIQAHKCILVRLKYFNMMFSSSWMESSEVNFSSIPAEYVEVLLDFLYDNSSSRLLSKKYSEGFITNMIVIADQLFVDRLKDIFQVLILKRFTMKRIAEWLELAYTYHCDLLKKSIFDFICANLREVLENRVLENVDLDYLTELDERYKETFPEVKYRQIVPSPEIDEEFIERFAKNFVIDLNAGGGGAPQKLAAKSPTTIKLGKSPLVKTKADYEKEGKQQTREESIVSHEESPVKPEQTIAKIIMEESSRVSAQLQEKNNAIWTKIADKKLEVKRKLPMLNANEVLRNEEKMSDQFSNLSLVLKDKEGWEKSQSREDANGEEGAQYNSQISFGDFFSSPPPSGSSVGARMSQKQRKRQNSRVSESECGGGGGDVSPAISCRAPESVWNVPSMVPANGALDLSGEQRGGKSQKREVDDKSTRKSLEARMINFDKILLDERREKEYVTKLKFKSLALTQLEEAAIRELLAFYNANQVFDETIVVARKVQQVSQNYSQWARINSTSNQANEGGATAGSSSGGGRRRTTSKTNGTDVFS